jgi:hypothetical protein
MKEDKYTNMLMRLPVCMDYVEYKGEDVVIDYNFEATKKANKPMVDIYYCLTQAINNIKLKTVQWDKNKFKPSKLSNLKW